MEIDIEKWLNLAQEKLKEAFSQNLLFIGLQGSYNRGEATKVSDIDIVVIIEVLSFEDLITYRSIINSLPYREKACGFISGKKELQNWSKSDLFHFFYDTKSLFGKLEDIIQMPLIDDIKKSIKINCENLYHKAVHSFIHSNNYIEDLKDLYKMTFFILQAIYFIETKNYIQTKKELIKYLTEQDKDILNICININKIIFFNNKELESLYKKLFVWCTKYI